ncbi:pyridoxamine 5'-phosphate oxidase [Pseudogemmobacter bohemicus]|uniref:pyridoxamine 5'-phosphate oxidase n=1 Tax=Pseudogemmobacter bohemicus TaxID=2250708 RepID=UPI000DD38911|nr:pyridoxamine 5'-phosphate oxidase [Pseudogemmobacter bohemicus]
MERTGIFKGDDPFAIARSWLEEAAAVEPNDPNAIALATVDETGLPDVRMVLLKEIAAESFVFYTNYTSVKGQEIAASGKAAFVMHWKSLRRQIRVRGTVTREEGQVADEYYRSRSLTSRLGAWASRQSQPLSSREALMAEVAKVTVTKGPIPARPPFWGGFRIAPVEIEFWADGAFRLHDRFRWSRIGGGDVEGVERVKNATGEWTVLRLNP